MKFLIILAATLIIWQSGAAQDEIELAYDDGNPNLELQFTIDGAYFVTRFTPPAGDYRVLEVRYFVADTSGGSTFNLTLWRDVSNEPGIVIYGPVNLMAVRLGWNNIDLSQYLVDVTGDFYVGLSYDGRSKLTIGAENRSPAGRAYDTDG
jgi:hypothetical protein